MSGCAHCGLPAAVGARFCCFGCELAARMHAEARDDHAGLYGVFVLSLVLSMIVMMCSLFLYAEDVFPDAAADRELAWMRAACRWAALLFATPVVALAGAPLARRAAAELAARRLSMEALIVLGASAAYALSAYDVLTGRRGIYLDSATSALVLSTFGRYLEAGARSRASRVLGPLLDVSRAALYRVVGGEDDRRVAAAEIAAGMRVEVRPEVVVPVDLVADEPIDVDLAVLTGESRPVSIAAGGTVPAGAVPVARALVGRALRSARESALERLGELARDLAERSAPTLRLADRFAAFLVPAAGLVALATLVGWTRAASFERGLVAALAVVLVACPCSYAIASPLVHWLALRSAFARGVLIRGPDALEALARARVVAFDKTGTLTRVEPTVGLARLAPGADLGEVRALVRAIEADATHPAARALRAWAGDGDHALLASRRFVAGAGVEARAADGREIFLGGSRDGEIALRVAGCEVARFALDEQLRPDAERAVRDLEAQGLRVIILSGDAEERVARAGRALGVAWRARQDPAKKVAAVEELGRAARTRRDAKADVVMVGDGLNDVPALAGCAASITLGEGAPLAKGVAQVTLLTPDLALVPWTMRLARRSMRLVAWLLGASTAYNVTFVVLAAAGALQPVLAGLSMLIASLLALSFAVGIGAAERPADDDLEATAQAAPAAC